MSGIYYALSIVGMLVIVTWFISNDGRKGTNGPLAMKPPPQAATAAGREAARPPPDQASG